MRITLNLATRPFADLGPALKRLRIAMGVLALLCILLVVALHAIHQKAEAARAREHSLDGQIARIAQEQQGYQQLMQQPDNAKLLKQVAVLNKLFDAKAFSWTLAMEDLETVLPGGVQVTTLEPEREKDGRITVHLRVIGPRNGDVDLVRNLEHSRHFLLPRIVNENAESNNAPGQQLAAVTESDRVQFDLLATYNPATTEQHKMTTLQAARQSENQEEPAVPHTSRPSSRNRKSLVRPPYTGPTSPGAAAPGPGGQTPGGPQ